MFASVKVNVDVNAYCCSSQAALRWDGGAGCWMVGECIERGRGEGNRGWVNRDLSHG